MNRGYAMILKMLLGLLCALTWTAAAAELLVVEMQPGAAKAARYSLPGQKKMTLVKLESALSEMINSVPQRKDQFRVAVLVDNRTQVGDIANLHGLMQKIGFADVRYFRFAARDKTRLSEIRLNFAPVIGRQSLERVMVERARRDSAISDAYF